MRTIALEEHYATEAFMEGPGRGIKAQAEAARDHPRVAAGFAKLVEGLCDIGEGRIAEMDAAGIDVQVLSLTSPGVEQLEASEAVALAREANDHLAEAVRHHPDRFAGFAALPTAAPEAAADELERTVREHGFVGALINGHTRGRYLDDTYFWPILERAEALGVADLPPSDAATARGDRGLLRGELRARGSGPAGDGGLGLAHRDRNPRTAARPRRGVRPVPGTCNSWSATWARAFRSCCPGSRWPCPKRRRNWIARSATTSARTSTTRSAASTGPRRSWTCCCRSALGRIMFSTDHPYASMAQARAFLDQLPVSPADKERIAHGNAERLLRL